MNYSQFLTTPYDFRPEYKWQRAEPFYGDLGYSLPIPWPTTTTVGWWTGGGIPEEKVLIMSDQPEWHAVNNRVRSNAGLPEIDAENPIYQYQMSDKTIRFENGVSGKMVRV
jgi:hypothetical protein